MSPDEEVQDWPELDDEAKARLRELMRRRSEFPNVEPSETVPAGTT